MTREEILSTYRVRDGRIESPGPFEGEMLYTPYFWGIYLDGGADEDDGSVLTFKTTEEDRAQFPELGSATTVKLVQDEQGFVWEAE